LPPTFLGAFDSQKMGFVPNNAIIDVFFNEWFYLELTPSNQDSKEFKLIKERIENALHKNHYVYDFLKE
jgi:non-homologous end joining protein Ku